MGCSDSDLRITLITIHVVLAGPCKFCDCNCNCIVNNPATSPDTYLKKKKKGFLLSRVSGEMVLSSSIKLVIVVRKLPEVCGEVSCLGIVNCHIT